MSILTIIDLAKFVTSGELREFISGVSRVVKSDDDQELLKDLNFRIQKHDRPKFNDCIEMMFQLTEELQYSRERSSACSIILSETVDNALNHGCRSENDKISVNCRFTLGGAKVTVRQPLKLPERVRAYRDLDAVRNWEDFNREGALGWQNIMNFSDHIEFPDSNTVSCSIYKTNPTISEDLNHDYVDRLGYGFENANKMSDANRARVASKLKFAKTDSSISVERTAAFMSTRIVRIDGRVDHTNSQTFLSTLMNMAEEDADLILDLGGMDFITSAGLRALLLLFNAQKANGRKLLVANVHGVVREVFRISMFDKMLPTFDEIRDAIAAIAKPS